MTIEFSSDQLEALAQVETWLAGDRKICTFGGYAGTGKSTLAKEIVRRRGGAVSVCAFTGKAAHVLRLKGLQFAKTMHRTIYTLEERCVSCEKLASECTGAKSPIENVEPNPHPCPRTGLLNSWKRVPLLEHKLVIVDEASMVDRRLKEDLESFDVRVLYIGDHGQLEPIGDNPNLMASPDIRLEMIHRQAAESPVLQFAHHVRQRGRPQTFGELARVTKGGKTPSDIEKWDMVLCGYNKTRMAVNAKIRERLGFKGTMPCVGERVVCLRNSTQHGIFNGMLATVTAVRSKSLTMDVLDESGASITSLPFEPDQFGCEQTLKETSRAITLWDFGYCLTVHKAQGSEWDRVVVLEQISSKWSAQRWRYTAATRAARELLYCT